MNGLNVQVNEMAMLEPVMGSAGEWGTAGGMAMREALSRGLLGSVMDLCDGLESHTLAKLLQEVGFAVSGGAIERGRDAVFAEVMQDLRAAAERRVDGFELRGMDREGEKRVALAAKEIEHGFRGDREAFLAVQNVMSAAAVDVSILGEAMASERGALLCVAAQAMQAQVQGFAFDGLAGKYAVPCKLKEVVELHKAAAGAVAVESVSVATDAWLKGEKVADVSRWVPDNVQRALQGSLSENSAHVISRAFNEGAVARFGAEAGLLAVTMTLADQGVSVNAATVAQQAEELGLAVIEPDRQRGKYAGPVVALDHCAALVKYARVNSIEVPFAALAHEQPRLKVGDVARVEFNKGAVTVKVAEREARGMGR